LIAALIALSASMDPCVQPYVAAGVPLHVIGHRAEMSLDLTSAQFHQKAS
jgi:hypothetical protein